MSDSIDQFSAPNEDSHVVDIDSVGEATFEVWPKGWKNFIVAEHTYELSQAKGEPMWVLVLEVDGEVNAMTGESDPHAGKKSRVYMSFSEKAIPFTKKTINQVWPGLLEDPQWRTNGKFDVKKIGDAGLFVGTKLAGLVKHQRYEGETRHSIGQIKRNDNNAFMTA